MAMGNCPEDYQCPTCGCDYRRIDATTWYCPYCDSRMTEVGQRKLTPEETRALFNEED